MTWWFHLLVRRVDSLRERVNGLERLVRAVGQLAYGERCSALLLQVECGIFCTYPYISFMTVTSKDHRPLDLPAIMWSDGSRVWMMCGEYYVRPGGGPNKDIHKPASRMWVRYWHRGEKETKTHIYYRY